MYVDKKLSGVTAVQTLSRLNRTHRTAGGEQKRKTFVIDFVNKPEDIRDRVRAVLHQRHPGDRDRPVRRRPPRHQARPGRDLHRGAGARGRRAVGRPARATTRSRPRSARPRTTSPAATRPRSRPTTRSPSTPSTCSARTSPPTSGSTTSCARSSTTATRTWRCCRSSCGSWRRSSPTPPGPPRSTSPTSSWSGSSTPRPSAVDISLTGDGELKGISAAGTGARKEPKYVALQVVIDKMNDLFGAESFTQSQIREFVNGLVQRLLAYPDLVQPDQGELQEAVHGLAATSRPRSPRRSSTTRTPTTPWPTTSSATALASTPSSSPSLTRSMRQRLSSGRMHDQSAVSAT